MSLGILGVIHGILYFTFLAHIHYCKKTKQNKNMGKSAIKNSQRKKEEQSCSSEISPY